jgi:hypothetical protein
LYDEALVFRAQVDFVAGFDESANDVVVVVSGAAENISKNVVGIVRILLSDISLFGGSLGAAGLDTFRCTALERGHDKKALKMLDIREHLQAR